MKKPRLDETFAAHTLGPLKVNRDTYRYTPRANNWGFCGLDELLLDGSEGEDVSK
jgi:hypothetical protein